MMVKLEINVLKLCITCNFANLYGYYQFNGYTWLYMVIHGGYVIIIHGYISLHGCKWFFYGIL